jgi:ABC-type uncharacterized transport system YnjBCD ATPase subunit
MNSPVVTRAHLVEARDVAKSFGQTPALRGASVAVSPGEIFAIMGPSGSGKSTLLHCLAGIFEPDRGEVWFDGQRLDTLGEAERTRLRRTAFGFVFQFGQLVPELTAADNVALPLLLNRVRRRAAYKTADAWLDDSGAAGGADRAASASPGAGHHAPSPQLRHCPAAGRSVTLPRRWLIALVSGRGTGPRAGSKGRSRTGRTRAAPAATDRTVS